MTDSDLKTLGGGRVYLPKVESKVVDKIGGLLDTIDILYQQFPKSRFLFSYELPEYNFRSEIPILSRFAKAKIFAPIQNTLDLWELGLLNKILYLLPFQLNKLK